MHKAQRGAAACAGPIKGHCVLLQLVMEEHSSCKIFSAVFYFILFYFIFKITAEDQGENPYRIKILSGKKYNQTEKPPSNKKKHKAD